MPFMLLRSHFSGALFVLKMCMFVTQIMFSIPSPRKVFFSFVQFWKISWLELFIVWTREDKLISLLYLLTVHVIKPYPTRKWVSRHTSPGFHICQLNPDMNPLYRLVDIALVCISHIATTQKKGYS